MFARSVLILSLLTLMTSYATKADAAGCSNCTPRIGGLVDPDSARMFTDATYGTAIAGGAIAVGNAFFAFGSLFFIGKDMPGLWYMGSYFFAGAGILMGIATTALSANLNAIWKEVPGANPSAIERGELSLAMGLSALGASALNLITTITVRHAGGPKVPTLRVEPTVMLDRAGTLAPGLAVSLSQF